MVQLNKILNPVLLSHLILFLRPNRLLYENNISIDTFWVQTTMEYSVFTYFVKVQSEWNRICLQYCRKYQKEAVLLIEINSIEETNYFRQFCSLSNREIKIIVYDFNKMRCKNKAQQRIFIPLANLVYNFNGQNHYFLKPLKQQLYFFRLVIFLQRPV